MATKAQPLRSELATESTESKRDRAREMILKFCGEQWDSKDGRVNHTVQQLRAKFDTLKAQAESVKLGVSWQSLIDQMVRSREILVTNGVVWLP